MSVLSRLRDAGFEVYSRKEWGSPREADGSYARRAASSSYRLTAPQLYHFLHITVTRDGDTIAEGKAGARQVEGYGYTTPPMVSYQMLVTNEARIFEGQNYGVKGTHTVNDKGISGYPNDLNRYGYATALMQNVGDEVTDAQVVAVAATFAAAELEGWVKRGAPVLPHRKFAWKECPGDKAVARLGEIEALKNQLVATKLPQGVDRLGQPDTEDDMPTPEEFWGHKIRNGDGDKTEPAWLILRRGRDQAAAAARGVAELAGLIKAIPGASDEMKALADDIVSRTAAEVERLDAAAVAERLDVNVTTKE